MPRVTNKYTANLTGLPEELRIRPQWVTWVYSKEKYSSPRRKVPIGVPGPLPPTTKGYDGIGFLFTPQDPYIGIDFDACVRDDGTIDAWVRGWLDSLWSYTEYSPSLRGVHCIVRGNNRPACKTPRVEVYSHARFFTMTGRIVGGYPNAIREADVEVQELLEEVRPKANPFGHRVPHQHRR